METQNLNEASMQRFYQHLTKDNDCIAIVSAERGYRTTAENNAATKSQRSMIVAHHHFRGSNKNYGFHKAKGGYSYSDPAKDKGERLFNGEEHSTCIYAHCETDKEELDFRKFVELLGQKFDQESVLFVGRDKRVMWIYTSGDRKGQVEYKGKWHPHAIEEYNEKMKQIDIFYTKIKGKEHGFENLKSPEDIKVTMEPMVCEGEYDLDFRKCGMKPSEIMHARQMFEVLDEAIKSGVTDFSEVIKHSYCFDIPGSYIRESSKENLKAAIKQRLLE